ncbi:sugar ABC transporter substrate-binding protein [Tabrizicola sp. BL-A-41-H6]|uniref:sugar ABC transporter substrate-binding protein n=1 Tax=Tabrizicola sp. BL-A-41-H6 TaxID=3421107 RepID=UPI003D677521
MTRNSLRLFCTGTASLLGATLLAGIAQAQPDVAAAKAMIDKYRIAPEFVAPGEPFDAKGCMAGKKIMVMPVSSANPFNKNIVQSMAQVAEPMGFEVVEWENQAVPTQWAQGMDHATNNGFDAVVLLGGVNPVLLGPQIAAAKAAGVSVQTAHLDDTTQEPDASVDLAMRVAYHEVGGILANWTIAQTDGKVNALIVGSDEIVPTPAFVKGITDVLDACGEGCKYTYVNAPVPEWSTKIQPSVQSAVIADPTINYIIPIYDSMSQFVLPALTITGKAADVKIATFNGTPFVIDEIQKGNVEMDVGESIGWVARSILDGSMRKLCGMETKNELYVPFYIFDKDNAASAGTPAEFDKGYGDSYIAGYNKLWGLE